MEVLCIVRCVAVFLPTRCQYQQVCVCARVCARTKSHPSPRKSHVALDICPYLETPLQIQDWLRPLPVPGKLFAKSSVPLFTMQLIQNPKIQNLLTGYIGIFTHKGCLWAFQMELQAPRYGSNVNIHQQRNRSRNFGRHGIIMEYYCLKKKGILQ